MAVVRFYSDEVVNRRALQRAAKLCPQLTVNTELCYNVELTGERPTACHVIIILIVQVGFFEHFAQIRSAILLFPPAFCVRHRECQRRAEGGSPLVVSPSTGDGATVGKTKAYREPR